MSAMRLNDSTTKHGIELRNDADSKGVQKLQAALHAKAKGLPKLRFYALYDKVYREDVLWVAHRRCLMNGGAAGVDGQTFEDIEAYGKQRVCSRMR